MTESPCACGRKQEPGFATTSSTRGARRDSTPGAAFASGSPTQRNTDDVLLVDAFLLGVGLTVGRVAVTAPGQRRLIRLGRFGCGCGATPAGPLRLWS